MGKKIWKEKSVSNSGSDFIQVSATNNSNNVRGKGTSNKSSVSNSNNVRGSGKGTSKKSNDTLLLILKILIPLILVGVAVVLVLDWYGIIHLGIFPKHEEKEQENGNGNN